MADERQCRGAAFRDLHEGDPFVIPNPWDVGSARVLEAHGFPALATTSSGFAFTLGRLDGAAEAGAVGGSIEDWDPDAGRIYDVSYAAERVAAAAEAAAGLGFPFTLTGRAENHVHGIDDLDDTIGRLRPTNAPARTCSSPPACATRQRSARSPRRCRSQ